MPAVDGDNEELWRRRGLEKRIIFDYKRFPFLRYGYQGAVKKKAQHIRADEDLVEMEEDQGMNQLDQEPVRKRAPLHTLVRRRRGRGGGLRLGLGRGRGRGRKSSGAIFDAVSGLLGSGLLDTVRGIFGNGDGQRQNIDVETELVRNSGCNTKRESHG